MVSPCRLNLEGRGRASNFHQVCNPPWVAIGLIIITMGVSVNIDYPVGGLATGDLIP